MRCVIFVFMVIVFGGCAGKCSRPRPEQQSERSDGDANGEYVRPPEFVTDDDDASDSADRPRSSPLPPFEDKWRALCERDDLTQRPKPTSTFPDSLGRGLAERELLDLNKHCGDTWCESAFDVHFHDLRCDSKREVCELTMRLYSQLRVERIRRVSVDVRRGPIRARLLDHGLADRCQHPCTTMTAAEAEACAVFDVRCEIEMPKGRPGSAPMRWYERVTACFEAAEHGIEPAIKETR